MGLLNQILSEGGGSGGMVPEEKLLDPGGSKTVQHAKAGDPSSASPVENMGAFGSPADLIRLSNGGIPFPADPSRKVIMVLDEIGLRIPVEARIAFGIEKRVPQSVQYFPIWSDGFHG